MIRIKVEKDIAQGTSYSVDEKSIRLPIGSPGEESIISTVSPIYRVANLNIDLEGSKVIQKEML